MGPYKVHTVGSSSTAFVSRSDGRRIRRRAMVVMMAWLLVTSTFGMTRIVLSGIYTVCEHVLPR